MRKLAIAIVLLATTGAAQAQEELTAWGYYQADEETNGVKLLQAGTVAEDGSQLILKCDKPGKREVYAIIATQYKLAGAGAQPPARAVFQRFDDGPVREVRWFYYPKSVIAPGTKRNPLLNPFLERLVESKKFEARFDPEIGTSITVTFNVTGAREAIDRVFENCKDDNPIPKEG